MAVHVRLGACRLVLEEQAGKPNHEAISKLQAAALADAIAAAGLSSTDAAAMSGKVVAMAWAAQTDLAMVLQSLTAGVGTGPTAKRQRRGCQLFTAITNYIPDCIWEVLTSDAPSSAKLAALMQFAARLGMRLPSEPTVKWLASVWIVCSEPPEALARMAEVDKRMLFMHVKANFVQLRMKLGDPPQWIEKLPDNPWELHAQHPTLWRAAFKEGECPGSPKLDVRRIVELDNSYGCRGGRPVSTSIGASVAARGRPPAIEVGNPAERMASFVMERMEAMQGSQARMVELILNQRQAVQPKAFAHIAAALEDRAPTITLSPRRRQMALPAPPAAAGDDAAMAPPAAGSLGAADLVMAPPAAGSLGAAALVLPPPPTVPSASSSGGVAAAVTDILDAIEGRKLDAGKAKAAASGATAATHKGEGKGKAKGKAAKAKAKAMAPPEAPPAKAKAVAPPAKAKAALPAKAKAVAPPALAKAEAPPAKAMAEAKAKGAPKAKAKAAAALELVLGCSKCRFQKTGCGQCRNPGFGGLRWNVDMEL